MLIAHRIALDPNNAQATYLARACGVARFAYNWALAEWKRQYEAAKANPALPKPSQQSLRRQLNAIKREQFPWMLEVTKNAPLKRPPKRPDRAYPLVKHQEYACVYDWEHRSGRGHHIGSAAAPLVGRREGADRPGDLRAGDVGV